MRRFITNRDRIIQYIGLHGAMPVLTLATGEPALLRPGEDESLVRRVAWPEFFAVCERRGSGLLYEDSPGSFEYGFVPRARAVAEVGERASPLAHALAMLRDLPVVRHG
ncbi:MAG: hypothetical protein HY901_22545 [Deltaproteobacteria bacterium]|nr:hypothetical protein [Deltaproteobacteria bacterium]